mmetsp:Transcript_4253/g.11405  ORF Transcript_4253/g.11405 Transcript_4253/m.11405 type:complete len:250 (+) Transcript_4253:274-1023(+)
MSNPYLRSPLPCTACLHITWGSCVVLVNGDGLFVQKQFLHDRSHVSDVGADHHRGGNDGIQRGFCSVFGIRHTRAMPCGSPIPLLSRLVILIFTTLSSGHHHVKVSPPVGAAPTPLPPDRLHLLLQTAPRIMVVPGCSPKLCNRRSIPPICLCLVWPPAQLQHHRTTRLVHGLRKLLVPTLGIVPATIVHLDIVHAPTCKCLRVLLVVLVGARRPPAVACLVAHAGVQTKLQAQRVHVINHRAHAVGKK